VRAAPRGPARGDFQQRDRRGAARTKTEAVGAWARTERPLPTRKVLGGYSRKRNVPRGSGATALVRGSCGSACAVCGMAHLLHDGPRGTRKSEPTRPVLLAMVSLVALRRRYRPEALLRSDGRPPALLRVATPLWLESIKGPRDVNKNVVGSQGREARVESTWLVNRDTGTACAQDR